MTERVFVFRATAKKEYARPFLYAFRESDIKMIESQAGSENCFLRINNIEVQGSFDDLVKALGERVDIK